MHGSRINLPPIFGSRNDLPSGGLSSVHCKPLVLVASCKPAWPLGSRKKEKRSASARTDGTDRTKATNATDRALSVENSLIVHRSFGLSVISAGSVLAK